MLRSVNTVGSLGRRRSLPTAHRGAHVSYFTITDESENSNPGSLPRVNQCEDGSYCCQIDTSCCANGKGVFLDEDGNVASKEASTTILYPPVSTSGTATDRYVGHHSAFSGPEAGRRDLRSSTEVSRLGARWLSD